MEYFDQAEMHILCLLDGKPGHEKQTFGIIRALGEKFPIKVTEIKVTHHSLWHSFWKMICLNMPFYRFQGQEITDPDLLICTGSGTHLQTLLYKKKYTIPAVTCMAPDFIFRSRFDLCFVPVHDGFKQRENIVTTVGPPNCSINRNNHKEKNGLILLGGIDQRSHRWNSLKIAEKIDKIIERECETEWMISSSPRTPEDMILRLEKMSSHNPRVSFYNYKNTPHGWLEEQYDKSAVVWVTADSVSMVYEALTAGCKVGVIPVDWNKKVNKFKKSVAFLADNGFILSYDTWVEQKGDWSEHEILNEAQRCADIIMRRLWKKNS